MIQGISYSTARCVYKYIRKYIYIYICNPPSGTHLFPVLYASGYKFSSSRLQRILHHVCASKPLPPTQVLVLP